MRFANVTIHRVRQPVRKLVASLFVILLPITFFARGVQWASAASNSLTFSPSAATATVGTSVSIKVLVNAGVAINAAEGTVSFPADKLEVTSLSKGSSVFTLWPVEPSFSNKAGTVTFAGGLPSPGIKKNGGTVLTMTLRAKTAGTAKLSIGSAQMTANDGEGTNVLTGLGSSTVTIKAAEAAPPAKKPEEKPKEEVPSRPAPTIQSSTHPNEDRWYISRDVQATWAAGVSVKGYSAVFDRSVGTVPPETSEGLLSSMSRTNLEDGVWYLHVRAQYDSGWSSTRHFAFRIDATAPQDLVMTIDHPEPTQRTAMVTLSANDAASGVDHFTLKVNEGEFQTVTSPHTLSDLVPGEYVLMFRAYDKAGNIAETTASFSVVGSSAPTVFFDTAGLTLFGQQSGVPALLLGTPLRLRGFARQTDTIHIVVRSSESVFDFPVADVIDPNPVQPPPEGYSAWKLEISPDLAPGEHTIHVSTLSQDGAASAEAPVIRFRVVADAVQIGSALVPYQLILIVLGLLIGFLLLVLIAVFFVLLHVRHTLLMLKKERMTGTASRRSTEKKPSRKRSA